MKLTLMYREYCGLCRVMREQLTLLQTQYNFSFDIIEIDDYPELEEKYNELVPVLLHNDTELCHWHLDENKLCTYLNQFS